MKAFFKALCWSFKNFSALISFSTLIRKAYFNAYYGIAPAPVPLDIGIYFPDSQENFLILYLLILDG